MKINISSLAEMAACLKGERLSVKMAALQEVYKQVRHAKQCGKKLHPSLVDLLYERYEQTEDKEERAWCTCILLQINDTRKHAIAEQEFFAQRDNALLLLCADTLAALPPSRRVALLGRAVMDAGNATRQRLAANLLSDCTALLAPDVALRVAILSDHKLPIEDVTAATLDLWIGELSGSYRLNVRRILAGKGAASFLVLLENWKKLPTDVATWAVTQALRKQIAIAGNVVLEILETSGDVGLLHHALKAFRQLPATAGDEKILESLYRHPESAVRAAALEAGRTELAWDRWLDDGVADEVRLAVLRRIAHNRHTTGLPFLARLLQDKNWKIRAAATDALTALAPDSLDIIKVNLTGEHHEARVCAAQALQRLGKDNRTPAQAL